MKVTMRKAAKPSGKASLFLDITGAGKRKREFLKLQIFTKPKTQTERKHNKQTLATAEKIREQRQSDLISNRFQIPTQSTTPTVNEALLDRLKSQSKSVQRKTVALSNRLIEFHGGEVLFADISRTFLEDFVFYLKNEMTNVSAQDFYILLRQTIERANEQGFCRYDPRRLKFKFHVDKGIIKKEVLTIDELKRLEDTPIIAEHTKRAFLFACYTGLRKSDIIRITWENVKGGILYVAQEKTGLVVEIPLSKRALQFAGPPGKGLIFPDMPKGKNVANRTLKTLCERAGINKHITFHCARHTFGTLVMQSSGDLVATQSLLGHSDIRHTSKYLHTTLAAKKRAVDLLE